MPQLATLDREVEGLLTIFFRAIILYLTMVTTMRAMGKHQLGQFQPYEFALAIMVADLLATPMADVSTPLLHGVIPILALYVVNGALTLACLKSDRIRAFISGKPSVVVNRGIIDRDELDRLCMSLSDLQEGLREAGILDPSSCGTAIVETDGNITAFPHAAKRAVTVEDLKLSPGYEGLPLVLIENGRLQRHNLSMTGKDEAWLDALIKHYGLDFSGILIASLDTQGGLHVQDMRGSILHIRAMTSQEVVW
jgi:uncharacterized membrane protein YcaP (DUF421 family)